MLTVVVSEATVTAGTRRRTTHGGAVTATSVPCFAGALARTPTMHGRRRRRARRRRDSAARGDGRVLASATWSCSTVPPDAGSERVLRRHGMDPDDDDDHLGTPGHGTAASGLPFKAREEAITGEVKRKDEGRQPVSCTPTRLTAGFTRPVLRRGQGWAPSWLSMRSAERGEGME
jgi:hypothetical protein